MKISDKLNISNRSENDPPTFSFEFFPPKTSQGIQNLYDRMDRMYSLNPLFIDVTWNAGGRLSNLSTEIVNTSQSVLGLETCLHLTCTNMSSEIIDKALEDAYNSGCQNILALRGDPPINVTGKDWQHSGDFKYAKDLIKYIKSKYGNHFCIGVAGYPESHTEERDMSKLIGYLKEKVDCGGDFIITQMFYDVDNFIEWCDKIKKAGINVPIIPGIMPITTYASFLRRAKWSEVKIPEHFLTKLEPFKDNDFKIRELGTELISEMCQKILDSKHVTHLHFYTMNLEKATIMILEKLDLVNVISENEVSLLPWRKSLNPSRDKETVRPIFWKNKKFNYVFRTKDWDEFPNGRWGNSNSPAFGEIELFDGSLLRHSSEKLLQLWGSPKTTKDLSSLFIDYLEGKLAMLPWSDQSISSEINSMKENLIKLNEKGIFTVNSQPSVNGVKSNDKVFGWGPKNGYIYQKQYLEFFFPKNKLMQLVAEIGKVNKQLCDLSESRPNSASSQTQDSSKDLNSQDDHNILTFFSVNRDGDLMTNLVNDSIPNAVTWGIFPNTEVIQPTIVEKTSFLAWKDEAFRLAEEWKLIHMENKSEETIQLLDNLMNEYVLVNIVDNDYVGEEKIFKLFESFSM